MGISREVFASTGGFQFDRFAEDIEFSIRMKKAGFRTGLIPDAYVFHKRRATFHQFFKQVFNFGKGRAMIGKVHPEEVKLTHWFPAIFTLCTMSLPVLYLTGGLLFNLGIGVLALYLLLIFLDCLYLTRHPGVAGLAIFSALLQLWGYGFGFLREKFAQRSA